jgi:hypothetical protein
LARRGQYQLDSNGKLLWPQVTLTPKWGESINSVTGEPSVSAFATLSKSVGRIGNISMAPWYVDAVEAVLTVMVTDALARTSSMAGNLGSLKGLNSREWMSEILPKGLVYGTGGSAFDYNYQFGDQSMMFEETVSVNGYGYGLTAATLLATLVLLTYSLIAMSYVVYSICFAKITSSSWESITELVSLALNSRPSPALRNTGGGIATLGSLKQKVSVRAIDDSLQMVFGENKGMEKVVENKHYR